MPTSTNALVELMNMVERWRQRTDYGPVVVVSQDGIGRWNIIEYSCEIFSDCPHCSELECIVLLMHVLSKSFNMERWDRDTCAECFLIHLYQVDVFQAVKTVRRHRPQLVQNLVRKYFIILPFIDLHVSPACRQQRLIK